MVAGTGKVTPHRQQSAKAPCVGTPANQSRHPPNIKLIQDSCQMSKYIIFFWLSLLVWFEGFFWFLQFTIFFLRNIRSQHV